MTVEALKDAGFCEALKSITKALNMLEKKETVDRVMREMMFAYNKPYGFREIANSHKMLFYVDSKFNSKVSRLTDNNRRLLM